MILVYYLSLKFPFFLEGLALLKGDELKRGEWISSKNKEFFLLMENDGNLVLKYSNQIGIFWQTKTNGFGDRLVMELSGDLVLYDQNKSILWHSNTTEIGSFFYIRDDGKFGITRNTNEEELLSKRPISIFLINQVF